MPSSITPDPSTPLTPEREQEIREREAAATAGPWGRDAARGPYFHSDSPADQFGIRVGDAQFGRGAQALTDREFAANAREDVPTLLAEIDRLRAELAGRPTRAAVLREAAKDADDAGGTYASRGQNEHAGAAFALMEHLYRKANEVEYAATPCSTPNACDDDGEPCDNHERLMGHQVGEHELCGNECTERGGDQ